MVLSEFSFFFLCINVFILFITQLKISGEKINSSTVRILHGSQQNIDITMIVVIFLICLFLRQTQHSKYSIKWVHLVIDWFGWLVSWVLWHWSLYNGKVGFYDIEVYIMANSFLCKESVLFQAIPFSISSQLLCQNCQKPFYFKLFNLFKQS